MFERNAARVYAWRAELSKQMQQPIAHPKPQDIASIGVLPMTRARVLQSRKPANRLYRGGKISEHRFRKVLRAFAGDTPPSALAGQMRLSINSIVAIYQRLRMHYVKIGVFRDFYRDDNPDGAPDRGTIEEFETYEHTLLAFHLNRVSRMRGIKPEPGAVDHHFCESCWRFRFVPFFEGRPDESVHTMMFDELLTYLRVGGPIGTPTPNLRAVREVQLELLDRRTAWLERSSPMFKSEELRASLREMRRS